MAAIARFILAALLILGSLLIGFAAAGDLSLDALDGAPTAYTVSEMLAETPLEEDVVVNGTVSNIRSDYTSEKGYTYQRFDLSDGSASILVFCSTYTGRVDVAEGDPVQVTGTFQEFYDTYEIYAECAEVSVR